MILEITISRTMKAVVVCGLLCLPAFIWALEEFDVEARLAEYAEEFPPTEADYHHDCVAKHDNYTKTGPFSAITNPAQLWPYRTLSYQILGGYTSIQRNKIRRAANEVARVTRCVRLVENKNAWDRVIIRKCGNTCNSYVGKTGGMQQMCVADWCVNAKGSLMHEFIHALGFNHEHQRYDRDSYIYVNYNNLYKRYFGPYSKIAASSGRLLTRYDYGSIMHYGAYSPWAKNKRQPVIIPRRRGVQIGQRRALSGTDIAKIQILYGCRRLLDSKYFEDLAGLA